MICAKNCQIINLSDLASTVQLGMKLEMSIVMWLTLGFQNTKEKCPHLQYISLNAIADQGWIKWKVILNIYAH